MLGLGTVSVLARWNSRSIPIRGGFRFAAVACLTHSLTACYSVPQQRKAIDRIDLLGASAVPASEIEERIATAESSRFLGLFQGVIFEYLTFDKYVLQKDLARIERFYKSRGYYDAKVRAARVVSTREGHVRVQIVIDEGEPVHIDLVRFEGLESLPFKLQAAAAQSIHLPSGTVFDEEVYEKAKSSLLSTLTNQGYAWAQVKGEVMVNLVTRRATIVIRVQPSHRFKTRKILITGLEGSEVSEGPVRRALDLQPGADFSTNELDAAKNALLDLGVFSAVEITWPRSPEAQAKPAPANAAPAIGAQSPAAPAPSDSKPAAAATQSPPVNEKGQPAVDIVVNVTPSLLHTLRVGGGGEIDVLRTDVHASVGWEDRNFLGGLRRFSVNLKPGAVLFPTTLPTLRAPTRLLPEGRSRVDLRQPGFPEARTNWLLRGEGNVYPLLLRPINEDVILGYREIKGATGFERSFFGSALYAAILGHVQANFPFTYHGPLDPTLGRVALNYLELETDLNFRDDSVRPHKGIWLGNNLQWATSLLRADIADVKEQPDLRIYIPISRTVTFAVRGSVGFLFPRNYGTALAGQTADPELFTRDVQLLYFRAFFSGGPNSNRGYPFRGIGPHGAAPFFSPNTSADQVLREECNIRSPAYDETVCAVPLGGLSLWESSAELRFPILGDLSGAMFADASDVYRKKTSLRMNYIHLSVGGGLRYATPIGPVRIDVGYRVPGLQKIGGELDPRVDGDPGTIFGAPIAVSIGVGEVF